MTKFKRWLLLLTATLTLSVVNVESLKATSLIHAGKYSKLLNQTTTSSTTDRTTEATASGGDKLREILDDVPEEEQYVEVNGTKIALTGIPQIDYVWDPNLPRELNGFNLSTYPFLDSMPADEDIGFDCTDKINGFYASIKFGCQLYHHCLYGVRSNFICANFTAFDQKTFICHFASEVDCKNSYKYWNRNDDLYKETTEKTPSGSSTLVPLIDRNLYKRPAPGSGSNTSPNSRTKAANSNKESSDSNIPQRNNQKEPINDDEDFISPVVRSPNRPLRRPRPHRRRRPQYDYYYYDDEYDDEVYERRRRPTNRRPLYYDDYDSRRHKESGRDKERRPMYDDFDDYEYDRRPMRNQRRGNNGGGRVTDEKRRVEERRRPAVDEKRAAIPDNEKKMVNRRKNHDDIPPSAPEKRREITEEPEEKFLKPSGSLYDRQRMPSKILRTVPYKEKEKFTEYKTNSDNKKTSQEYYEDYEDEIQAPVTTTTTTTTVKPSTVYSTRYTRKQSTQPITTRRPSTTMTKSTTTTTSAPISEEIYYYDDEYEESLSGSVATTSTAPAPTTKSKVDFLDLTKLNKLKNLNDRISAYKKTALESGFDAIPTKGTTTTTTTTPFPITTSRKAFPSIVGKKYASQQTVFDPQQTSTTEYPDIDVRFRAGDLENDQKSFVKIYKRPFLPSRGGNPYKARGLSPVGPSSLTYETSDSGSNRPTTLEDIYNEEYDVELNDALNPNLKPLTSSSRGISYPSSFTRADGYSSQSRQSIQRADVIANSKFLPSEAITYPTSTTTAIPPSSEAPQYEEYEEYEYK